MGKGVKVRVWGDLALFSRPEMKVERCSYDMMTPSAARGILEAIYWHPGMRWIVDRIYLRKPVRFTSIRRKRSKEQDFGKQCAVCHEWRGQAIVYQQ